MMGTSLRIVAAIVLLLATLLSGCATAAEERTAGGSPTAAAPASDTQPDVTKSAPGVVDYSCETDADCAVKNVGNCCGYYPACVNRDSPTFPDQVKAECAAKGMSSICGFPSISGCVCRDKRCEAQTGPGGAAEVQ